jgi:dipeptidyl aminopeptidase/acylaminoacyl peptidase
VSEMAVARSGSWPSPISAEMVAEGGLSLSEPHIGGGHVYWIEGRPLEGGRQVIVRGGPFTDPVDVIPEGFNARTRVHEYGGASYWLAGDTVFFSNFDDQRLYRRDPGSDPRPITPSSDARMRYADGCPLAGGDLAVCVRERHGDTPGADVVNEVVALPMDGSLDAWVVAGGRDFFAFPRPSPDGRRIAWTCWDHPSMPWDSSEVWVADLDERGRSSGARRVAGGPGESVQQPSWSPDGILHFVSDRSGWWNLYRLPVLVGGSGGDGAEALHPLDAEFGQPSWEFGLSSYAFLEDGRIACTYGIGGEHHLALLDPGSGEMLELDLPYTSFFPMELRVEGSQLVFVAGSPTIPHQVVSLDFTSRAVEVIRASCELAVDEDFISVPSAIDFPTEGGEGAHGLFYPPTNPDARGPDGDLPPLLVFTHGGPTDNAAAELDLRKQFWTSRGFAIVDVDYGGSSGYGREYRERLKGRWGIVDVHDCIAAARFLAERGDVDGARTAIRGGSAGGYTTLCALTFHSGMFAAGASYYGIGDVEALARDTHKFESRYLDGLIGPYPERTDLYHERSPVRFTDMLATPVILFQGLEDEVVPPSQAERMIEALGAKGLAHAYLSFEGEQHGFRRAENVKASLEAELSFYAQIFGFEPAGNVPRVHIENL